MSIIWLSRRVRWVASCLDMRGMANYFAVREYIRHGPPPSRAIRMQGRTPAPRRPVELARTPTDRSVGHKTPQFGSSERDRRFDFLNACNESVRHPRFLAFVTPNTT